MITTRAFTVTAQAVVATFLTTILLGTAAPAFADTKAPDKKADKAPADKAPAGDKAAPTDSAPKKEVLSEAEAKKFLTFFEKLVSIVVATQDDCAKMASGINAHIDANQALIKEANEAKNKGKDLPPSVRDKLEKKTKDELQPAVTKKCVSDKPVQAAFMRLSSGK
jgi:hypothetical protein